MVRQGADDGDDLAESSEAIKDNWSRTLHDMRAMSEDREADGYDTVVIPAGDTAPKPPGQESDEWGLVHVVPDNKAEPFLDLYEGCEFDETGVYQMSENGHVFIVTEHIDESSGAVIYIAGSYRMRFAPELVRAAKSRDEMQTHVKTLDGTKLGHFEHDDVDAFFPDPDSFLAYEYDA